MAYKRSVELSGWSTDKSDNVLASGISLVFQGEWRLSSVQAPGLDDSLAEVESGWSLPNPFSDWLGFVYFQSKKGNEITVLAR